MSGSFTPFCIIVFVASSLVLFRKESFGVETIRFFRFIQAAALSGALSEPLVELFGANVQQISNGLHPTETTHMQVFENHREAVLSLSEFEFRKLIKAFGGAFTDPRAFLEEVERKDLVSILCLKMQDVLGIKALTREEREEQLHEREVQASDRAATAAEDANRIAKEANRIALDAKRIANLSMRWTAITGVVAILALVVSLIALCKN
jgi:hypothetical protein